MCSKHTSFEVGGVQYERVLRPVPDQWVVLLEAAPEGAQDPIHADDLTRLLDALEPGRYGGTLDSADRYAL